MATKRKPERFGRGFCGLCDQVRTLDRYLGLDPDHPRRYGLACAKCIKELKDEERAKRANQADDTDGGQRGESAGGGGGTCGGRVSAVG